MSLFAKLDNYHDYLKAHPFHIDIGVKVLENDQLDKKQQQRHRIDTRMASQSGAGIVPWIAFSVPCLINSH